MTGRHNHIELWATNAFQGVLNALSHPLEQAVDGRLATTHWSSNRILAQIASGGRADALIATRAALEQLAAEGLVARDEIHDLASVDLGFGIAASAPRPDLTTPDAVRRTLLDARRIVYSATGASAGHFLDLIGHLGIAAEVRAKAIVYQGALVGEVIARGEADIGAQMVSEIVAVPGVVLAGALPAQFRSPTLFSFAPMKAADRRQAVQAVLDVLTSPAAASFCEAAGMSPHR